MRGPETGPLLLGPPSGQHSGQVASGAGGPKFLKICSKIHFLSYLPGMLAKDFGQNLSPWLLGPASGQHSVQVALPKFLKICSKKSLFELLARNAGPDFWFKLIQIEASSLLGVSLAPLCGQNSIALASWRVVRCHTHTSIRTSRLEGRRAGRCILRRRDSRCVVSERHRAGVLGLGCPRHGELARPASPHEVGEGALTAVCPPAGPNLPAAQ